MAVSAPKASSGTLTYEQYLAEGEIHQRYDIIDGLRVYFMPSPTLRHQEILMNLLELLRAYQRRSGAGRTIVSPFDVLITRSPLRTRQPDLLFVGQERLDLAGGDQMAGPLTVAPDLVVEILSPSETDRSRQDKIEDYRAIGVPECWIVDPAGRAVEVLRLTPEGIERVAIYGAGETVRSAVLPDLAVPVDAVFAG